MGSDLYSVSKRRSREWDRTSVKRRLLLYGIDEDEIDRFLSKRPEERWIEAEIFVDTIHPDCSAGWDPAFVIRVFDEGVMEGSWKQADKDYKKPYEYDHTPLVLHYGGWDSMWGMDFRMTEEKPSVAFVAQVEHFPGLKRSKWDGGLDDSSAYVAFIPKDFVPLLDTVSSWASRAWQGNDYRQASYWPKNRAPQRVWSYFLPPLQRVSSEPYAFPPSLPENAALFPHPTEGSLLFVPGQGLFHAKAQTPLLRLSDDPRFQHAWSAAAFDGKLWFLTPTEIFGFSVEDGAFHPGLSLPALLRKDGVGLETSARGLLLLNKRSIHLLQNQVLEEIYRGKWLRCKGDQAGDIWVTQRFNKILRFGKNGERQEIGGKEGLHYTDTRFAETLPHGATWLSGYAGIREWKPGCRRLLAPEPLLEALGPRCSFVASAVQGKTRWLLTSDSRLVALTEGQPPISYLVPPKSFDPQPPPEEISYFRPPTFSSLVLSASGEIWFLGLGGLAYVALADLPHLQGQVAENADFFPKDAIRPWAYQKEPSAWAQTLDLAGKKVAITGVFGAFHRPEIEDKLATLQAKIVSSVSSKTDLLLAGQDAGQALVKAKDLQIPILSETDFLAVWARKDDPPPPPTHLPPTKVDPKVKKAFPMADIPFTPHTVDHAFLRQMLDGQTEEISPKAWSRLLEDHAAFLQREGRTCGRWQIVTAAGLPLALFSGASSTQGQLSLERKKLSAEIVLQKADLASANLTSLNLEGRDLSGASLQGAMATDSFFQGASLEGADLRQCDFSRSDLRGCVFRGASLEGADFEKADLRGADFSATDVSKARFPGANLAGVIWSKPKRSKAPSKRSAKTS